MSARVEDLKVGCYTDSKSVVPGLELFWFSFIRDVAHPQSRIWQAKDSTVPFAPSLHFVLPCMLTGAHAIRKA